MFDSILWLNYLHSVYWLEGGLSKKAAEFSKKKGKKRDMKIFLLSCFLPYLIINIQILCFPPFLVFGLWTVFDWGPDLCRYTYNISPNKKKRDGYICDLICVLCTFSTSPYLMIWEILREQGSPLFLGNRKVLIFYVTFVFCVCVQFICNKNLWSGTPRISLMFGLTIID